MPSRFLYSLALGAMAMLLTSAAGFLWLFQTSPREGFRGALVFEASVVDPRAIGIVALTDIDGDGFVDIVFRGEPEMGDDDVVWYEYPGWRRHVVMADTHFRSDALAVGDLDHDQDSDLVVVVDEPGEIFWLENPGTADGVRGVWPRAHRIGRTDAGPAPDSYVKDLVLADLDRDGLPDVAARTHTRLFIFRQKAPDAWTAAPPIPIPPREGMDSGDLDGDGDIDLVFNGYWLANPGRDIAGEWRFQVIDPRWWQQDTASWKDNAAKVKIADLDRDGRRDVLLSHSEQEGYPVVGYLNRLGSAEPWLAVTIAGAVDRCHTLQAGDLDLDGDPDVLAAEMPAAGRPGALMAFLNRGDGQGWSRQTIAHEGTYSAATGDIGGDGDLDIVGGRNWNLAPLTLWSNQAASRLSCWTYIQVDDRRAKWGDSDKPEGLRYLGLAAADASHDGYPDLVSGRYFYRNPGPGLQEAWRRIDLGRNVDAILMLDVDGDAFGDIIAQALPDVFWLEAVDLQGDAWTARRIGRVPPTDHRNSQGFAAGQIVPGGRPEVVLAGGPGAIYYFEIPPRPEAGDWPRTLVTEDSNAEGLAVGDIDGDGRGDIAAAGPPRSRQVAWWRNPVLAGSRWHRHAVGFTDGPYPDRVAVADLNGDRRPDIVVTEESPLEGARTYWFEQPREAAATTWLRHLVAEQFTTNSLDAADMDGDGDTDLVTGEHRGTRQLAVWENRSRGREWVKHLVDEGRESHLGARAWDLDHDGDADLVSIAWDDYQYLHLWRNDAPPRGVRNHSGGRSASGCRGDDRP